VPAAKYQRLAALDPDSRTHKTRGITLGERFMKHVKYSGEHWIWVGSRSRPYGWFGISDGESANAHSVAYRLWVGAIPAKHHVEPCSKPFCVRPEHQTLRVGFPMEGRRGARAKLTDKQAVKILSQYRHLYDRQCSSGVLAREYGVSRQMISNVLAGSNGGFKLSRSDCEEIRQRYMPGPPIKEIAERYGVPPATISNLLRRKTYRNAA
jgi:hypothetical protein